MYEEQNIPGEEPQTTRALILNVLRDYGPLSRSEMVPILGIARTTIYDHLVKLMDEGLVESYINPRKSRGRPSVMYKIGEGANSG